MRVISQDKKINVPYENNAFCISQDTDTEKYIISARGGNMNMFLPIAAYDDEVSAMNAFNDMIAAGERCMIPNGTFDLG